MRTALDIHHYWTCLVDKRDWCFFYGTDGTPYLACEDDA